MKNVWAVAFDFRRGNDHMIGATTVVAVSRAEAIGLIHTTRPGLKDDDRILTVSAAIVPDEKLIEAGYRRAHLKPV